MVKIFLIAVMLIPVMALAGTQTQEVDGVVWTFYVWDGEVGVSHADPAEGVLKIPSKLGGYPVTRIEFLAFASCREITSVVIPEGVTSIEEDAFRNCGLTSVTIPSSVMSIVLGSFVGCKLTEVHINDLSAWCKIDFHGSSSITGNKSNPLSLAEHLYLGNRELTECVIPDGVTDIKSYTFAGCRGLTSVTIPSSVTNIGTRAFGGCRRLKDVYFNGVTPLCLGDAFTDCDPDLVLHAPKGWKGRSRILGGIYLEVEGESGTVQQVNVTVTNVVVNYVLNSIQPEFAIPATSDAGLVNIITEVKGGAVAVPSSWAENYPTFTTKFGSDFTKALSMKTGKKDGSGNDMFVWQDYVAGTDPTKEDDVFKASITVVDGKVTISYSPELDDMRKAMRKYTTLGKKSLLDTIWTEIPEGQEAEYNFFKVMVEMR